MPTSPPSIPGLRGGRTRDLLPGGRALIGSILVVASAAGVLATHRAATAPPDERFVVATRPVSAGSILSADDLGTVALALPSGMEAVPAEHADDLIGSPARHDLREMDLVRRDDVGPSDSGPEAGSTIVPVEVPRARALLDSVHAGSRVDLLSTDPDGSGTAVLAAGVLVVGVDDRGSDGIGASDRVGYRLAVPGADTASAVVDASVRSELTIVLSANAGVDRAAPDATTAEGPSSHG